MGENIQEKVESKENLRRIIFGIMCKVPLGASGKLPAEGRENSNSLLSYNQAVVLHIPSSLVSPLTF